MAAAGGVRWLLALGLAWLGPTSRSEFPDLTLVLQPDQELDWGQINRWMGQVRPAQPDQELDWGQVNRRMGQVRPAQPDLELDWGQIGRWMGQVRPAGCSAEPPPTDPARQGCGV